MLGTRETGNETYARELALALCARDAFDLKLLVTRRSALPPQLRGHAGVVEIGDYPSPVRVGLQYPVLLRKLEVDLVHMTSYVVPPFLQCPAVVTVLDVSFLVNPELVQPRVRWQLRALVGPSIRLASRVITISEASKRDIVRLYKIGTDKVIVTPLAASGRFAPARDDEKRQIRKRYDLAAPYILAVGNILPRKNLTRLVEAFGRTLPSVNGCELVIVGQSAWKGSAVETRVRDLGLGSRVRFLGYVPDEELPALYSAADVFCFPSIYEGFGLPLVEAMACGVATIVSNASSLPEVAGDAAISFAPDSVDEIASALRRALTETELRRKLIAAGYQRAAAFTWDRTAQVTERAYSEALRSSA